MKEKEDSVLIDSIKFNSNMLFLKDKGSLGIIKIDEIESITYDSIKRKCEFNLSSGKTYEVNKKFSEIEEIQGKLGNFVKVERGTIINLNSVYSLNFKNSCIEFDSGNLVYINKLNLKKLESILIKQYSEMFL